MRFSMVLIEARPTTAAGEIDFIRQSHFPVRGFCPRFSHVVFALRRVSARYIVV